VSKDVKGEWGGGILYSALNPPPTFKDGYFLLPVAAEYVKIWRRYLSAKRVNLQIKPLSLSA